MFPVLPGRGPNLRTGLKWKGAHSFFFFPPFLKWLRWRRPRPPRVSGLLPGTGRGVRGAGGGKDFELRNRSRRNAFHHLRRFSVPNHTISSTVFRGPCCLVCFRDPPSLTSHRLRSREHDLGYKIRTRCVQNKTKQNTHTPNTRFFSSCGLIRLLPSSGSCIWYNPKRVMANQGLSRLCHRPEWFKISPFLSPGWVSSRVRCKG